MSSGSLKLASLKGGWCPACNMSLVQPESLVVRLEQFLGPFSVDPGADKATCDILGRARQALPYTKFPVNCQLKPVVLPANLRKWRLPLDNTMFARRWVPETCSKVSQQKRFRVYLPAVRPRRGSVCLLQGIPTKLNTGLQ